VWQILETKQKFISQLYAGNKEIRTMADLDDTTMNFSEIKAIASDNPEIMEKFQVDMKVQELKLKERNYKQQKYNLEDKVNEIFPNAITESTAFIENCKKDIEIRDSQNNEKFEMEVNGKTFYDTKEAGYEIINSVNHNINCNIMYEIGKYKGFTLYLENGTSQDLLHLCCNTKYTASLSQLPNLNIERLDKLLASFEEKIQKSEEIIQDSKRQLEQCKIELQKPFKEEEELKLLLIRQSELNNKLNLDKNKNDQLILEDEETEETEDLEYDLEMEE